MVGVFGQNQMHGMIHDLWRMIMITQIGEYEHHNCEMPMIVGRRFNFSRLKPASGFSHQLQVQLPTFIIIQLQP
jgi:hypothetical protein